MDASKFWDVISNYNEATYLLQVVLLVALVVSCMVGGL